MFDFDDLDDEVIAVSQDEIDHVSEYYPGDVVKGLFMKAQWYLATIQKDNGDGSYTIVWNDGDAKDLVKPLAELKLVRRGQAAADTVESDAKRASEREAREQAEASEREEREAKSRADAEERARVEREESARRAQLEKERAEREALELAEAEKARKERERADREALERAESERKAKAQEDQANALREAMAQAETEERERRAKDKAEQEARERDEPEQRLKQEQATSEKESNDSEIETKVGESRPLENASESPENDAEDQARYERELKEKSIEDQKQKAEVLRKEKEKRVLEKAGGRLPGVRVKLKDMKEKPQMNEACGTLVEQKGERWIVNLDGAPGVGKGKWMVNGKNLVSQQWNCSEPKIQYSIVGSWNNWSPVDLEWDVERQCWHHTVTVGDKGWESFQFIAERDPNKCVHPDQKDASPHMPHKMCGPDFEGHGQNWAVGKHPLDKGKRSSTYEIRLTVWEDESPRTCEWHPPGAGSDVPVGSPGQKKYCISGTWNNWVAKEMDWDEKQAHFYHFVQLSSQGWESFQILQDGDYKKCVHPSIADANPFVPYTLGGPDNRGHGKNWTIGKHALDKGCKGARYKVRFFPADEGRSALVDWEPVSASVAKSELQKGGTSGAKKFCIAGTWGNWSAHEMSWDEKRRCYVYTIRLGLNGWESFQILVDGDYKKCIHPDCTDATPHETHNICGPDSQGHGKNWTIGRHRLDLGSRGSRFEVRLYLDDDRNARSIEWERVAAAGVGK